MHKAYLGIDLGTSSVKVLFILNRTILQQSSCVYETRDPAGWINALAHALGEIRDLKLVRAVGLCGQAGTYIINGEAVLHWHEAAGMRELDRILQALPDEVFLEETGMKHPKLISYPLPRLLYAKEHFPVLREVLQPKDLLIRTLTDGTVSDPYTWRGLANAKLNAFSLRLLRTYGIDRNILPKLTSPFEKAGTICPEAARLTGLAEGTPVYTGLNDFYAALLGMGIITAGEWFDLTGTSEHLGLVQDSPDIRTDLISSPYLTGYVHYGVTASSGASLIFGRDTFPGIADHPERYMEDAPVFWPYLNGERAPVFDPQAKGAFYGITGSTTPAHMAYAVQEGVAFSLYDIFSHLHADGKDRVILGGGAADMTVLNRLKAALLNKTLLLPACSEASALGAAMTAMLGEGELSGLSEAASLVTPLQTYVPDAKLRSGLLQRFEVYRSLYRKIKES